MTDEQMITLYLWCIPLAFVAVCVVLWWAMSV